jgi:hypothetical protein
MPLSKRAHAELVARIQESFAGHEDTWREQVRAWGREVAVNPIGGQPVLPANPSESYRFALLAAINDSLISQDASVARIEPWPEVPFWEGVDKSADPRLLSEAEKSGGKLNEAMLSLAAFGYLKHRLDELSDEDVSRLEEFAVQVENRFRSQTNENVPAVQIAPAQAPAENKAGRSRSNGPSTSGKATDKIRAALMRHHKYEDGYCGNDEPIGVKALATLVQVAPSTVSDYFKNSAFDGHSKYKQACVKGTLGEILRIESGELQGKRLVKYIDGMANVRVEQRLRQEHFDDE